MPVQDRHTSAPFGRGVAVTTSDVTVLPETRSLWIGGAGAVTVTMMDGTDLLISGIVAGTLLPIRCTKVKATGTTATLILALY